MIFLTNDILQNREKLENVLKGEIDYIDSLINLQIKQQDTISNYMNVFFSSPEYINIETVDELKKFSIEFKENLSTTTQNIELLSSYKKDLENLSQIQDNSIDTNHINEASANIHKKVLLSISEVETSLQEFSKEFCKYNATKETTNDDYENESIKFINQKNFVETSTLNKDTDTKPLFDTSIPENTLLISEKSNLIYLPYTNEELRKLKDTHPDASIDAIINKYYTRKAKDYRNPPIARFKEAYKLVRNKEKMSIIDASNLGLELCFKSNLHPAIISACRSINELDEYLGCLEHNRTDKFCGFHVKFDITPTLVK